MRSSAFLGIVGISGALLFHSLSCNAQSTTSEAVSSSAISPDRPNFVNSPQSVSKGTWQVEFGGLLDRSKIDADTTRTTSTPAMLRIGMAQDIEVRLSSNGFISEKFQAKSMGLSTKTSGQSDLTLAAKFSLQEVSDAMPGYGVIVGATLASGSAEFKGNGTRPSVLLPIVWNLPNGMSLGIMPGVYFDKNSENKRFTSTQLGVVLSKSFNEKWGGYVEWAAPQITSAKNGGNITVMDAGVNYLISNDLMLDFSVLKGISKKSPSVQVGLGLSMRF
jgi:hypothetical protein